MIWVPIVIAIVVWFWPRVWFRVVRSRLDVSVQVSAEEVEIGKPIGLVVSVRNRSWLPCPYVQITIELPSGLSSSVDTHRTTIAETTYLLMRQEVKMQFQCYGWKRGSQDFSHREMVLRINEGFGIKELFLSRPISGRVRVMPARVVAPSALLAIRELNGEIERMHWLMPDEALLRGIRNYESGDAFKYISWQATARTGTWMTKQFSSSMDLSVGIILSGQFFEPHWIGTDVKMFDELCSLACSLGEAFEKQRVPVYFATNAVYPEKVKTQWFGRQTAWGLRRIGSTFAPYTTSDLSSTITLCAAKLPQTAAVILVTAHLTLVHSRQLQQLARTRPVTVLCPTSLNLPSVSGVRIVRWGPGSRESEVEEVVSS